MANAPNIAETPPTVTELITCCGKMWISEMICRKCGRTLYSGTRVITLRVPKLMHEKLKDTAHDRHTSMNKAIFATLLEDIEPSDSPKLADPQEA